MIDDSMAANRIIGMIQPKKNNKKNQIYLMLDVFVKLLVLMRQMMEDI